MRILTVNYEYPPLGGGGGVAAANLAREFVRRGHAVDYVTTHFGDLPREEHVEGIRVVRVPVWGRRTLETAGILSMLSYPVAAVARALRLARQCPYDLIHTHFAIPSGPAGCFLAARLKRPNVLTVYGGDIYDPSKPYSPHRHPLLKRAVRYVLDRADLVVPESEDLCRRTKAIYRTCTEVRRIPLGFVPKPYTAASRQELGLRAEAVYAIAVSRLIPRKGYPDLLEAFRVANVDALELLIIGDGPERPKLERLCVELGIAPKAHFLGYVADETKYQYLTTADFFALATQHEGYGIVFQEAMYCGLPIATTNEGGQTDFLREGRNALLTRPADPAALAHSLRRLATDSALRETLAANNRKDIRQQTIDVVAAEYLDVFEALLARARAAT